MVILVDLRPMIAPYQVRTISVPTPTNCEDGIAFIQCV